MRHILDGFVVSMALLLPISQASACLWDSEVDKSEREFKSKYVKPVSPPDAPSYPETDTKGQLLTWGGGAGAFLLLGAVVICLRKPRS